jgi:hypothetical protein
MKPVKNGWVSLTSTEGQPYPNVIGGHHHPQSSQKTGSGRRYISLWNTTQQQCNPNPSNSRTQSDISSLLLGEKGLQAKFLLVETPRWGISEMTAALILSQTETMILNIA